MDPASCSLTGNFYEGMHIPLQVMQAVGLREDFPLVITSIIVPYRIRHSFLIAREEMVPESRHPNQRYSGLKVQDLGSGQQHCRTEVCRTPLL